MWWDLIVVGCWTVHHYLVICCDYIAFSSFEPGLHFRVRLRMLQACMIRIIRSDTHSFGRGALNRAVWSISRRHPILMQIARRTRAVSEGVCGSSELSRTATAPHPRTITHAA